MAGGEAAAGSQTVETIQHNRMSDYQSCRKPYLSYERCFQQSYTIALHEIHPRAKIQIAMIIQTFTVVIHQFVEQQENRKL
jgi:hypothetical protein